MQYTPWNQVYANLPIWHATDQILAEQSAEQAVTVESDHDCEFAVAMTELFVLRAQVFKHANYDLGSLARSMRAIELETAYDTWINPDQAWPDDVAGAMLKVWAAHR